MLEDILEQPEIISSLAKKYFPVNQPLQGLELNLSMHDIYNLNNIYIVASGSSRNAGNIVKYFMEHALKLPVIVDYASEFAHRAPAISKNDLFIAISQSGETADTYSALKIAVSKGAHTIAITNNPDSKIYRLSQSAIHIEAGKEKSIPATKSFIAQLITLYALTMYLGEKRSSVSGERMNRLKKELHATGEAVEEFIENSAFLDETAKKLSGLKSLAILGRGANHAAAQEGALKIMETSYIDATGYPTGEFMHGYVAMVDENAPVLSIILKDDKNMNYNLCLTNTEEIKKKRNPDLIIIKSDNDKDIEQRPLLKDSLFLEIPSFSQEISSIFVVVLFQLLALKIANILNLDVNNPRSLSKAIENE